MKFKFKILFFFIILNMQLLLYSDNSNCFENNCISCPSECTDNGTFKCSKDCNTNKNNNGSDVYGKTFFSIRPQDSNSARRLLALSNWKNKKKSITKEIVMQKIEKEENIEITAEASDSPVFVQEKQPVLKEEITKSIVLVDNPCHFFALTFEWQQSFNKNDLAKWFSFNCSDCFTLGIVSPTESFDVDAEQFGLCLATTITTTVTSGLVGKVCMNPEIKNFIAELNLRFNLDEITCGLWTQVDFIVAHTKTNLNLCVVEDNSTECEFPSGLFTLDCSTTQAPYENIYQALLGDEPFGEVPCLQSAKLSNCSQSKTGLAAINFDLGYDFLNNECGDFSLFLHVVIPTGNKPKGKFVFEPIVGANKSWQLGLGFYGSSILCDNNDRKITLFCNSFLTHLFKSKQTRVFALKNNGAGSQYLLLKQFVFTGITDGANVIGADRVANILTGETGIGADIMFDGSLMFQYKHCNFIANLGYNFWIRTKEKRDDKVCFRNFAENSFGIKADLPLSQSTPFTCEETRVCASNFQTASQATLSNPFVPDEDSSGCPTTVFLTACDIDFTAPLHPTALSNKIFGAIGYENCGCKHPYFIQIAGEVEFGNNNKALDQWGVMLQGGFSY